MQPIGDLNNMYFFAAVVDAGGFSAAARDLGLQASKLSRRISALERELEVRLLNRNSRSISLTESGKAFHAHCRAVLAEAQAARDTISQALATPRGLVRMSCPPGLLHGGVSVILGQMLAKNPGMELLIEATNRKVDVLEEGFDVALRVRLPPLEDSDLAMRTLAMSQFVLVAAPDLVMRFGPVSTIEDLAPYPTLAMSSSSGRYMWQFTAQDGTTRSITHRPRLATDDLISLRDAALEGIGATHLPKRMVYQEIASGRLAHLLPQWTTQAGVVHAVFPSRKGMVPAVRTLLDALAEGFREAQFQ
ncbi:MAG TPA: LysR substrate-binding domain-containing protein [Ramlibacter sp.]|uniref:LysR substrate-binding domain-containing protein n=1 Tax=Ramlibacter sp. TaxID=1917967 RepID=UPI002BDC4A14|nr:LysR substrate-binding domain-containing protein [Ramlibacter sp.]HVZ45751.1 LysR substrate-binding domain-containing protein [Ramlibacter sp.]